MGLKMVNQIDLFNTESPEKSGIQTLGFHYQNCG